jgi:hypothetical protein
MVAKQAQEDLSNMAIEYSQTSPYYNNPQWGRFLDVWPGATINPDVSDALYQIDPPYNYRPDILAYDLYGDANLWWVFAVRNPNTLIDPVFNFVAPTIIYLPSKTVVFQSLGL